MFIKLQYLNKNKVLRFWDDDIAKGDETSQIDVIKWFISLENKAGE